MVRTRVRVRILGLGCRQRYLGLKLGPGLRALICLGLLNRGVGPKAMVPIMPLFFPLEKYHILDLLVVGNGGLLMLVCSNVRVFEGFSIFGNTFNAAF